MIKKILVALVALIMATASMTACSKSSDNSSGGGSADNSSSSEKVLSFSPDEAAQVEIPVGLTINGEDINTDGLIMCTINGHEVSFEEFRYFWLTYCKTFKDAGFDMSSEETIRNIKSSVEDSMINFYGILAFGEDNGVEFGDDVQAEFDDTYLEIISSFDSVDAYAKALQGIYMTDSFVRKYYYDDACCTAIINYVVSDSSPYVKSKEDFLAAVEGGEFCKTLDLLIPYSIGAQVTDEELEGWDELTVAQKSEKYNAAYSKLPDDEARTAAQKKAKQIAEDVLAKAEAGDDFYELIAEYNLDPGMTLNDPSDITSIDGYYITKDYNFVTEYIDAAFALKENEISDLVETAYGYHIIKRMPIDMDYINANITSLASEYSDICINKAVYDYLDNVKVEYSEYYDSLTADSIT